MIVGAIRSEKEGAEDVDLTLVIMGSRNDVICDDDSLDGVNPALSAEFYPGEFRVFVGTYGQNDYARYTLVLHEK